MYRYMKKYINSIDEIIKEKKVNDKIIEEHLIKIKFFQHERLIHLLVTLFFAIFLFIFLAFSFFMSPLCYIIVLILMICLFLYVIHYFFLENSVQYMYKQYDELKKINNKNNWQANKCMLKSLLICE